MDQPSEDRLQLVCPKLADLVRQLVRRIEAAGHPLRVVQALRSWNQQAVLWAQGRAQNPNGDWHVTDPSIVVTNAPPGHSWHNFGLAVDVCPSQYGPDHAYAPDWNAAHPVWTELILTGKALGMVSGSCFHNIDNPHFQLTGRFPVSPDGEVRQLFTDGGMQAIWEEAGL